MQVSIIISLFSSALLASANPAPLPTLPIGLPVSSPLPTNLPISAPVPPIAPPPPTGLPIPVPPVGSGIAVPPVTSIAVPPAVSSIIASIIGGGGGGLPSVAIPPIIASIIGGGGGGLPSVAIPPITNLVPTATGVLNPIPSSIPNLASIPEILQIILELIQAAYDLLPQGTGTNLPGTNLPGTNLPGTNLPGTNLPGTNLPGTNLPGTNLPGANPPGANIPGISGGAGLGLGVNSDAIVSIIMAAVDLLNEIVPNTPKCPV